MQVRRDLDFLTLFLELILHSLSSNPVSADTLLSRVLVSPLGRIDPFKGCWVNADPTLLPKSLSCFTGALLSMAWVGLFPGCVNQLGLL